MHKLYQAEMLCLYLSSNIGKQLSRCLEWMNTMASEYKAGSIAAPCNRGTRTEVTNAGKECTDSTKPYQKTLFQSKIIFMKIYLV